jgi:uncharacterized repeat protein (TIGR02543 family)
MEFVRRYDNHRGNIAIEELIFFRRLRMFNKRSRFIKIFFIVLGISAILQAMPAASRITLPSGKKIFAVGMNLAWINYAGDVGNTAIDTLKFDKPMKDIADSGANCMRIWLSTDGTHDPVYGSTGLVTGAGTQTVANIQKMLKLAKKHNLVLVLVLLTHNWVNKSIDQTILANNKKMLTTDAGLQAYIDNYLVALVKAIGNDPNLLCWEIFNEPEGMVDGWSSPKNTITQAQVQKAVNWIAAAIHTNVSNVLVSNGAASLGTMSWYTDNALSTVGTKTNGTLDFYMAHYYGWNGTSNSPFTKTYASWNLDKPLIIGEYASTSWSKSTSSSSPMQDGANVDTLLTYLDKVGYAGGLGWQYQQDGGDPWMKGFPTFGHSMAQAFRADSASIKLTGGASNTFVVSGAATSGGTVKSSIIGRVDSSKTDTLTATAATGYSFKGWTGDTICSAPILIIKSVVKDWSITANFEPDAGTNLLKAGDFSDTTKWKFYSGITNGATISYANGQANISVAITSDTIYKIQFSQNGFPLDSGASYILSFDGWSTADRAMNVDLTTGDYKWQDGETDTLTATKKTFHNTLLSTIKSSNGEIQFNVANSKLIVYIDNVSLTKVVTSSVKENIVTVRASSIPFKRIGNRLYWTSPSPKAKASLMNLQGRVFHSATMGNVISLNAIPSGVYFFVVNNQGAIQACKVNVANK